MPSPAPQYLTQGQPTATTQQQRPPSLRDQVAQAARSGQGFSGNWGDQEINDFVGLLQNRGVSSWGPTSLTDATFYGGANQQADGSWWYGDPNSVQYQNDPDNSGVRRLDQQYQLNVGGTNLGYLGDANNDGSYSAGGDYLRAESGQPGQLGWSARGDGSALYYVERDAQGRPVIGVRRGADGDVGRVMTAAGVVGGVLGAGALASSLGGAAGAGAAGAGGGAGGAATNATNAALIESAAGTGGYGASSAGLGGGATASWGAGAGYAADGSGGFGDLFGLGGETGGSPFEYPGLGSENGFSVGNVGAENVGQAMGDPTRAALYGDAGYGPGMTGAETSAFDAASGGGSFWDNLLSRGGDALGRFGSQFGNAVGNQGANMLSAALLQRLAGGRAPSINYGDLAAQQGRQNLEAAQLQNQMNRLDTTTPYGSVRYGRVADPNAPGGYRYTQDVQFSPEQQRLYQSEVRNQQGMQDLAGRTQGQVSDAMSERFSLDGLPASQRVSAGPDPLSVQGPRARDLGTAANYAGGGDSVRDSILQQFEAMNGQRMQEERDRADATLKNQGLMPGTEAYDRAMGNILRAQGNARNDASFRAIQAGGAEQSRLAGLDLALDNQRFGQENTNFNNRLGQIQQALQGRLNTAGFNNNQRQQSIQEMLLERQQPLNEFNALRTGNTPTLPQFQGYGGTSYSPVNVMGAGQGQYNADIDAYNRRIGNFQQLLNLGTGGSLPNYNSMFGGS